MFASRICLRNSTSFARELVCFDKVTAVYEKTILERGPGEVLPARAAA
jgi:hypothetical protein